MTPAADAEIDALIAEQGLPGAYRATVDRAAYPLAQRVAAERARLGRPVVVGLCGGQGSGKSTLAGFVAALLERRGVSVAVLSIDDLYLTRAERQAMARERHPLFATRGPPGTHDVGLGLQVLDALTAPAPGEVALPRFDKARDTRADPADWPRVRTPVDVAILEGWMVGARPEPAATLAAPVNALEREDDADGRWRSAINAALAGPYQALFSRLDLLVLLQPPSFEQVFAWRALQEDKLAARLAAEGGEGAVMDRAALHRFIAHYERLTRWILREMPARADVVIRLGRDHAVTEVKGLD